MCRLIFLCEITTRNVCTKKRIVTPKMGQSTPAGNGNETVWHEFETTKKKAIYLYDFQT